METKSASIDNLNWKSVFAAWFPVVLYMTVIFMLSAQQSFPQTPTIQVSDKLVHFAVYCGLCLTTLRAAKRVQAGKYFGPYVQAFTITAFYGAFDEFHQALVPNRTPDVWDWAADISGAIFGLCIAAIVDYYCKRR